MFHKILVALDRSDQSSRVFEEALAIAKADHARLMLIHVLSPFEDAYPSTAFAGMDGLFLHQQAIDTFTRELEIQEKQGLEYLRALTDQATEEGIETEYSQNLGSPGSTICTMAKSWNADLVVVGRRSRGGIGELLMGSVSNYVLHHVPCSLLVVQRVGAHPPAPAGEAASTAV